MSCTGQIAYEDHQEIITEGLKGIESGQRQGKANCCWAFAAVAALESLTQIQTGKLISMSEKQLLDCSTTDTESSQSVSGYKVVPANDENALTKAVTDQPVSIGIDASGQAFCNFHVVTKASEPVDLAMDDRVPR
ncbi:hypothetical protein GQ457_03G024700 [Hibiscus cannabinus]